MSPQLWLHYPRMVLAGLPGLLLWQPMACLQVAGSAGEVVVCSARIEAFIKPRFDAFTEKTGIQVNYFTAGEWCFRQLSHGKRESIAIMPTEIPPQPSSAESHLPWSHRRRISTTDLMQGAREVIIVHEGEEYVLHITKTGKLILTK